MALIAPGIVRYTINGTYSDRPVANIVDVKIDTTGTSASRSESAFDGAGRIINAWKTRILPLVQGNYIFNSVSWVDMDDEDGSTGTRTSTSTTNLPLPGTATGDDMPGSVAALIRKTIAGRRGFKAGRLYLAGLSEAVTDPAVPNAIIAASVTAITTGMTNFAADVDDSDEIAGVFQVGVTHTVTPDPTLGDPTPQPVYAGWSKSTVWTCDRRLATQRRRLRG